MVYSQEQYQQMMQGAMGIPQGSELWQYSQQMAQGSSMDISHYYQMGYDTGFKKGFKEGVESVLPEVGKHLEPLTFIIEKEEPEESPLEAYRPGRI